MELQTVNYDGLEVQVNMPDQLAIVLAEVNSAHRGRFAFVKNHVSGKAGEAGCEIPGISDMWFLSLPRYDRYIARIIAAMQAVDIHDVVAFIASKPHYLTSRGYDNWTAYRKAVEASKTPDIGILFETSKKTKISQKQGTDPTTEGQRAGHRNCFGSSGNAKVHFVTEKDESKHMFPVLDGAGRMTASSVMLPFFEIRRWYSQYPKYKSKNSRYDTVMRDAIEETAHKAIGLASWKRFSLQKGNFTAISLDSKMILGWVRDLGTAELDASLADAYRAIGALSTSPLATLTEDAEVTVSANSAK